MNLNGYSLECRESIGGIAELYLIPYGEATFSPVFDEEVVGITNATGKRWYKYGLKGQPASVTEHLRRNKRTGTILYEQELTVPLPKLQATVRNELKALVQYRVHAIVKDRNGRYWLLGKENGAELLNAVSATGVLKSDYNGYSLSFKAFETEPMYGVNATVVGGLEISGE